MGGMRMLLLLVVSVVGVVFGDVSMSVFRRSADEALAQAATRSGENDRNTLFDRMIETVYLQTSIHFIRLKMSIFQ